MGTSTEGFWIAPSGDIIPVPKLHINMVLEHPEKFRLTKKQIQEVYEKHKEPVGLEGKARAEIMSDLIKEGWIRVRYFPRNDSFTVQLNKLNERNKNHLYAFASEAIKGIEGSKFHPNGELKIMDLNADVLETLSLKDAASFKFKEAKIVRISDFKGGDMEVKLSFNLQRLVQHIKENSFGIISGFQAGKDKKENLKNHNKLKEQIRSLGYGYKEMKGFWKGESKELEEEYSLFVPKITYKDIVALAKEYNQEAVVYGNKDEVVLLSKTGNPIKEFTKTETNAQEAWESYSKLKNKSFRFSSVDWYCSEPHTRNSFIGATLNEAWFDVNSKFDLDEEFDNKITVTKKAALKLNT